MRNLWVQVENPFVTWTARLEAVVDKPERVRSIVDAVLLAGSTYQVFKPQSAPVIGYDRDRDGELRDTLSRQWNESLIVDAGAFTGAAMHPDHPRSSRVTARVATYDHNDEVSETEVDDLGRLLRALEPVPGSISQGFTRSYPPVRLIGPRLAFEKERDECVLITKLPDPAISIALHSDIWFPFVFGSSHPLADHQRMFDNRELASRHTPQLNRFIADVARAVRDAGAEWSVDPYETGRNAALWLDDTGIRLDSEAPDLMPPEALDAEWY
jgi:hypothetical protein